MKIDSFEALVKTECSAVKYIAKICWDKKRRFCIRCKGRRIYSIRRQRYRCGSCKYEFSDWTGRFIGRLNISAKQWLWIVKLYELEIPEKRALPQLNVSHPTMRKAFEIIRQSLAASSQAPELLPNEQTEAEESSLASCRQENLLPVPERKIPLFGIHACNGVVKIEPVPEIAPETLLTTGVQWARRGNIVYTDPYKGFDALIFFSCRKKKADLPQLSGSGKVHIDRLNGFWGFAKERLIKPRGVSAATFSCYLKELEFRYNHRDVSLFELIMKALCQPADSL